MRNRSIGMLVLLLPASVAVCSESVDLKAESNVYFSSNVNSDKVTAAMTGASCDDAEFTVTIQSRDTTLFRRAIPMSSIIPCDRYRREPEQARWWAAHVVNGAVSLVRASDRSCNGPRAIGCWESPSLERLRRASLPLLCFSTNSEGSSCVAYDPEAKAVIEAWRYSE